MHMPSLEPTVLLGSPQCALPSLPSRPADAPRRERADDAPRREPRERADDR